MTAPQQHAPSVRFTGSRPLTSHRATVLFDSVSGQVVHVHHVIVIEGGAGPDEEGRAALAHDAARRMGHETAALEVLHVDGSEITRGSRLSVDVTRRSLIREDLPEPDPPARRR